MFKEDIQIGMPVIYWGVIDDECNRFDPFKTVITSEPWALGHGAIVCKIAGKSGGVSIDHLDMITAGSLMAAKLSGLTEISMDDINDASRNIFSINGCKRYIE